MRWSGQKGQSSTEYMILVSVVVTAILSAAYTFVPTFEVGVNGLATDVQSILDVGTVGGIGLSRGPSADAGSSTPADRMTPMTAPRGGSNSMRDAGQIGHLPKADDPLGQRCTTDHC